MYGAVSSSPSLGSVVDLRKTWAQIDSLLEDKLIGSKLDWRMLADSIAIKLKETETTHQINEVANDHEKEKEDSHHSQVENYLENSTKFVRLAADYEKDVGEDENLTEMQSLLDSAVGAEHGDAKTSLGFVVSDRIGFSYVQVPPAAPAGETSKNAQKIRGVVAREKLLPGTMILVEKPYLGVLDVEVARRYGDHWQDLDEAMDTDALACQMVTADPDFAANFDGSSAAEEGGGGGGGMNSAEGGESEDSSENSDSDAASRFGPDAWVQLLHPKGKEDLAARAEDEGGEEFDYSSDEEVDAAAKEADLKRYLLTDAEMSGAQEEDVDMLDKVDKKASKLQDGGSDLDSEDSRSDAEELRQLQKQVHAEIRDILSPKFPSKADRDVLRAKTRYNSLGFYTANEQFCNPLVYKKFMGTGLYLLASHFNHSCAPNVARFSIGDITVFVVTAEKAVEKGEELCISYIPTEECGEPKHLRDENLSRDFVCACAKCRSETAGDQHHGEKPETGDEWAFVDEQLTAQLQLLPPLDALDNIDGMLESAKLLNHHKQELRGLKAIKLMHLGKWERAQTVVSECIEWQVQAAGRFDESVVVYHLLAGICALAGELVPTEEIVGADFPSESATSEAATETASKKRKKQAGAVMKQVGGGGVERLQSFQEHIAAARETFGVCTGWGEEGEDLGQWLWEKNKLEVEEYATWLAFAIEKNLRETIVAKMKTEMIGR